MLARACLFDFHTEVCQNPRSAYASAQAESIFQVYAFYLNLILSGILDSLTIKN